MAGTTQGGDIAWRSWRASCPGQTELWELGQGVRPPGSISRWCRAVTRRSASRCPLTTPRPTSMRCWRAPVRDSRCGRCGRRGRPSRRRMVSHAPPTGPRSRNLAGRAASCPVPTGLCWRTRAPAPSTSWVPGRAGTTRRSRRSRCEWRSGRRCPRLIRRRSLPRAGLRPVSSWRPVRRLGWPSNRTRPGLGRRALRRCALGRGRRLAAHCAAASKSSCRRR